MTRFDAAQLFIDRGLKPQHYAQVMSMLHHADFYAPGVLARIERMYDQIRRNLPRWFQYETDRQTETNGRPNRGPSRFVPSTYNGKTGRFEKRR